MKSPFQRFQRERDEKIREGTLDLFEKVWEMLKEGKGIEEIQTETGSGIEQIQKIQSIIGKIKQDTTISKSMNEVWDNEKDAAYDELGGSDDVSRR